MKEVVIMGAGPAGLAAGYELTKQGVTPTLCEMNTQVGGISKTIECKGNHFDLGGHRFFTKLDDVNRIWHEVLGDKFLKRPRMSRIYYNNKFFNYPLTAMNALMGVRHFQHGGHPLQLCCRENQTLPERRHVRAMGLKPFWQEAVFDFFQNLS